MFDEEPEGDPHGECVAEIGRLQQALRSIKEMTGFPDDESVGQLRATLIGIKAVTIASLTD